ncbi:MAG: ABC transporter ATP-binding protein [Oligoflexales bacterium]
MIEVKELFKSFGNNQVLDGLSFEVARGEVTAFLGANGSGKTTTLDIICGCLGKDSGKVILNGKNLDTDFYEISKNIGYLPEQPPLYGELRVHEALVFVGGIRKLHHSQLAPRISQILGLLSLESVKHRLTKNLSKGMRQRLGFAQALMHDPAILVLDEPTDGLDPEQIIEFKSIVTELAQNRTILISSHNLTQVEGFCDHVIILKDGRLSLSGKLQLLVEKLSSTRVYHLQLEQNLEALVERINTKEFLGDNSGFLRIKSTDPKRGLLELELPGKGYEFILDRLIEFVLAHNCGLRQLKWEKSSLEDIYFDVAKR